MRIHEIDLDGYEARWSESNSKRGPSLATWGSFGLERLHLNPGEGWQGMTVTATFLLGDNEKTMVANADGMVDVPPQALAEAGNGVIVFSGDMAGAQRITADIRYKVIDHSEVRGDVPEPTPDAFHQYIEQTNQYREEAAASAASAAASAQQAAASADGAAGSAEKAGEYADNAYASANVAALQATNAKNSAAAAADSAEAAAASAAEAAGSEASVAADAEAARQAASAAEASETAAVSSASAAKTSETNAASSKTAAASSASAAKTSETNAASSKTAAANSATAAASSAGEAADSAAAAADSAAAAAASAAEAEGITTYQHRKLGTEHHLIGKGPDGKAKMTADVDTGDTVVLHDCADVDGLVIEGKTTQAGTGDPSPENIRAISGVGMYDQCVVLDGSSDEDLDIKSSGSGYADYAVCSNVIDPLQSEPINARSSYLKRAGSIVNSSDFGFAVNTTSSSLYFRISGVPATEHDYRAYLQAHPLIIWYKSVDYYKSTGPFYTVVELSDDPYRAVGFELTQPLFDGDSLKVSVPSGCDQMIVLDGTEQWQGFRSQTPAAYAGILFCDLAMFVDLKNVKLLSDRYDGQIGYTNSPSGMDVGACCIVPAASSGNKRFCVRPASTVLDIEEFKNHLSDHPLIVFYKSVDFTEEKDIPVVLEKHTKGLKIVTGTEAITEDANGTTDGYDAVYSVPCLSPVLGSVDLLSSHYKGVAGISPASGNVGVRTASSSDSLIFEDASTLTSLEEAKSYFAVQHTAGTPVQVVYELAAPVEYARLYDGTTLPAYIGTEDFGAALDGEPVSGKWLTFTQDGTQVNFKGGGLSGSKLAAADAEPGDVRTGKKFYAGDKTIKTGTLPVLHMGESHQINRWQNSMTKEVFIQANTIPEGIYESDGNTWSPQINIPAELFGNAADSQVLAGVTFTSKNGAKIPGTMPNQGAKTTALNAGESYTIPAGYHNGSGKVTANSLASQTDANAAAGNILAGKTAWVKGAKITGTMTNRPGHQETKIAFGNGTGSIIVPIPKGAYLNNGESRPDNYDNSQNSSIAFLAGTATPDKVLTGNRFCSAHGVNIAGTMANRGAPNQTLGIGGSYSLSAGYYSGGKISAKGSFGGSGSSGDKSGDYSEIYRNESNWTREIQARSHASASISGKTVTITVHAEAYQRANDIPSLSGTKSSVDYSFSFNIG